MHVFILEYMFKAAVYPNLWYNEDLPHVLWDNGCTVKKTK
jgi:hypothetical protein